ISGGGVGVVLQGTASRANGQIQRRRRAQGARRKKQLLLDHNRKKVLAANQVDDSARPAAEGRAGNGNKPCGAARGQRQPGFLDFFELTRQRGLKKGQLLAGFIGVQGTLGAWPVPVVPPMKRRRRLILRPGTGSTIPALERKGALGKMKWFQGRRRRRFARFPIAPGKNRHATTLIHERPFL